MIVVSVFCPYYFEDETDRFWAKLLIFEVYDSWRLALLENDNHANLSIFAPVDAVKVVCIKL